MLRAGQAIFLCVVALLMLGVVMVNSADMAVRSASASEPIATPPGVVDVLASRSTVYAVLAIAAMLAASLLPIRTIATWAEHAGVTDRASQGLPPHPHRGLWGLAIGCALLVAFCALVYVPGLEREVNGSRRWVNIPGVGEALSFQPSEVAKWSLILIVAWYCARRADLLHKFWLGLAPALAGAGLVAGFIVVEDLGTGALIALVAGLVLLAGGANWKHFLALAPFPIAGLVGAIATSDYRSARITAFLHPFDQPEGIGYHTVQSLVAIANGHGVGRGLGFGIQKLGYLPEDRTDFVFAVICEELGIPGAAVVVVAYALLLWCGYAVLRNEKHALLRLVTLGVIATVGTQAIINLAVVTAMAPTKGIALPLISAGGTGWLLTAFSLGLVVAIDRTQDREVATRDVIEANAGAVAG
jgi:cell division protein FtsW